MENLYERTDMVNGKTARIFPALVAGRFYPDGKEQLTAAVKGYLAAAKIEKPATPVKALLVPHAGYQYSAPIAAYAYQLIDRHISKVVVIGSNHNARSPFFRMSACPCDYFESPLGRVKGSPLTQQIIASSQGLCQYVAEAHVSHIIEVQLPFLQVMLDDFELIPLVTGALTAEDITKVAQLLDPLLDERSLVVMSSDLSHYHPYQEAVKRDRATLDLIASQHIEHLADEAACGKDAIAIIMHIARQRGWRAEILDYRNSGDTAGGRDEVVGYGAMAFF